MGESLKAAAVPRPTLDDKQVAEYLRAHPDFLSRHPELLELLELRHASGPAVSLIERQVEILRGKNQRLEDKLGRLLEAARDNEKRASHVHKLARTLIRAPTLAATVKGLAKVMKDEFQVDDVFVGVHAPTLTRQDIEGLARLDGRDAVTRGFDDFFRTRLVECGPLDAARAKLLFPNARELPQSAAIVPLDREKNLGMLVLASRDPQRFTGGQGKYFLEVTAELVTAAIRARLG
jgi:uncharacterized protein